MKRLGDILHSIGLVTAEELHRAERLKERRGGRLGPLLVSIGAATQEEIDHAWVHAVLTRAVLGAIDRACGNRFTAQSRHGVEYSYVHREDTVIEDMLNGAAIVECTVQMRGEAILTLGENRSLPVRFVFDASTGFVVLDDSSEAIVRRWVDRILSGRNKEATTENKASTGFEAALNKLFTSSNGTSETDAA